MTPSLSFEALKVETVVPELFEMTFPSYRKFLTLEPSPRHPEQGDKRIVQPVGVVGWQGETPVGLLLAERPLETFHAAEVLSIFVVSTYRNRGVGTRLVETLEGLLAGSGATEVSAVYMTGKPDIMAVERIFEKRGWSAPETRAISVRFAPEEALKTPWFDRVTLPQPEFEIVPWTEIADAEKRQIVESHQASPWIAKGLEPWRHDFYGFDRVSSLGLRYRGRVVGWVINHEMGPGNVRFTCSFMHPELSKRGRIFPLYSESLKRLREAGCRVCTFVTPMYYKEMAMFLKRRCVTWGGTAAESRGVTKKLSPTA